MPGPEIAGLVLGLISLLAGAINDIIYGPDDAIAAAAAKPAEVTPYFTPYADQLWYGFHEALRTDSPRFRIGRNIKLYIFLVEPSRQQLAEFLYQILGTLRTILIYLWERLFYALRFFCNATEWPGRIRPPCTTMPWNIWPALVVLWGVCWMFYDCTSLWSHLDDTEFDLGNWTVGNGGIHQSVLCDIDIDRIIQNQDLALDNEFSRSEMDFEQWLQATSLSDNYNFDGQNVAVTGLQDPPLSVNSFALDNTPARNAITNHPAHSLELAMSGLSQDATDDEQQSTAQLALNRASSKNTRKSTNKCEVRGCSQGLYDTRSALKKHINRAHNRQFKCSFPECTTMQAFATSYDLQRHRRSKHRAGTSIFCRVAGCKQAENGHSLGFARPDNLRAHMRRMHPQLDIETAVILALPNYATRSILNTVEEADDTMGERLEPQRHTFPVEEQPEEPAPTQPAETSLLVVPQQVPESFVSARENIELRRELQALKEERDMLWKMVDTLRKQI